MGVLMRVGILQFSPVFGKKKINLDIIERLLKGVKADLIVLPELSITGYLFTSMEEIQELSETVPDGPSVEKFKEMSAKNNIHIVTGFLERYNDKFYNSAILVYPSGEVKLYRKVHLFYEEKLYFEPGNLGFPVFSINNVKVGIMVCFDWVYPEAARSLALKGAEVIAHPANLVLPYCQDAMITRSIENRVFTITANRCGKDIKEDKILEFTGKSQIISPKGERLLDFSKNEEAVKVIDIEPQLARDKWITKYNHLFKDRRTDMYNL